jgi:hypothetical protein
MTAELIICALATWQAVEIYHHGSIFDSTRARIETYAAKGVYGFDFIESLTTCPFCLSVWVAGATILLQHTPLWPINAILVVSRLANLANDATCRFTRTPNRFDEEDA